MLTEETLLQPQRDDVDSLTHQELNGQRRTRDIAIADLKDGKNFTEGADGLRLKRHSVMRWRGWFACNGVDRLAGKLQYRNAQRLPKTLKDAFRRASNDYRTALATEAFVPKKFAAVVRAVRGAV